jgi:multiple antibiotic resistance protein
MLFVQRAGGRDGYLVIAGAVAVVLVLVWLTLRFCGVVVKVLRPGGIEVLSRIAGLLLAAIAVQLIADSITAFVTNAPR